MRIVNLASGSKANSTFVSFGDTKILIDAGLADKQLQQELGSIGESLSNINAVLVTHEHVDHVRAIKNLAKKFDMDFYIKKEVVESGFFDDVFFKEGKLHKIETLNFNVGDFEVQVIETLHDSVCPVAYVLNVFGSKSKVAFLTDLGEVSDNIKNSLVGVKMIFIESNYDEKMLINGKYPYIVKQRILGRKGHLSNKQSLELAKFLFENGTKCFVLSHISQNNNLYELALENYVSYFESIGAKLNEDVFVRMSLQDKHGNNFVLKEEN